MARADLTGAKIRLAFADDPSGKDFEEFFRRLLEAERALRHVVGSTQIDGPDKPGSSDGGKDCVLIVHEPPRRARADFDQPLLTWDDSDPTGKTTYYSLKAGQHWPKSVHKDVGYSGHLTGHEKKKNDAPKRPTSSELLPLIAGGNRYVIVVAAETTDRTKTIEKVCKTLEHHMAEAKLSPPSGWRDKIGFIDANHLAEFIRYNYPILPAKLDDALGLSSPPELDRFDEWTRRLKRDRPDYVPDEQRERVIAQLNDPQAPRVIRIFGPPGVGKTRLVHEALRHRDESIDDDDLSRPTDAVYYTEKVVAADDVVYGPWLRDDAGAVTLVVDEVVSSDVDALSRTFLARVPSDRGARLVLIGVSDEDAREGLVRHDVLRIRLRDLSPEATRELVGVELGAGVGAREDLVRRVLVLAKGFPHFAVLLARALAEDEDALADGQDEAGEWWAAKRVLAGSKVEYGGDAARWRREATVRAMCLLVAIMTGDEDRDWDGLWACHGDALCELVADTCDWQLVKAAYADCINREILRHVGRSQKRYVSPANLARMILNHFLGGGPDDLGPRLSRLPAQLLDRLSAEARRVDASATVIDRLTRALLAEIERRRVEGHELAELLDARDILYGAVDHIPDEAARTLSATVLALGHEALVASERLRHRLRGLFQDLVQAPVSQATFADLEHALFRMALVDDELWANNATGIWASLFLVALSQSHQPWSFRFELLQRRCVSGPEAGRLLAVNESLSLVAASTEHGLGHAPGRTWPTPTEAEYRARKRDAWVFLLTLCLDTECSVASAARKVVAAQLRGCVMDEVATDAELLAELGEQVGAWSVADRRDLGETLADIRRYDDGFDAPVHAALTELAARLDPASFGERLVAWVGSWHPGDWAVNDPERAEHERRGDEELVQEGLAVPELLIVQWPWLRSQAARRQRPFMRTLGQFDVECVFLPSLEDSARDAVGEESRLLAWYVEGWSREGEGAGVDTWLSAQLDGGFAERTAGFVLPFLEPSERRLAWLIELVEQDKAQLAEMSAVYRRWVVATQPASMLRLLDALAAQPALVPVGVSLAYELLGIEHEHEQRVLDVSGALLEAAAVRRLPAIYEHDWVQLLEALARRGRGDVVGDAVLTLLTSEGNPSSLTFVERVLHKVLEWGLAEQLWERAAPVLDGEQGGLLAWYFARGRVLAQFDAERILGWVGERESRAAVTMAMVNPYGATLPRLARELLRRFGDEGRVASALASRVRSTPRAVTSLIEFKRHQLANAERWAEDEIVEVRRWAIRLAEELRDAIAEGEAHELFRRKLA